MSDGVAPSKGAWTPGPWDVIPVFILQSDKEAIHFSEYRIREFGGGADYVIRTRTEAEANAKLIAQAPTMSELLREYRSQHDICNEDDESGKCPCETCERAERLLSELEVKP